MRIHTYLVVWDSWLVGDPQSRVCPIQQEEGETRMKLTEYSFRYV